jgi:hypothetical protein
MTVISNRVVFPIAVLLAAFASARAVAQPAGKGADKATKAAEKAEAKAEKAEAKADKADAKAAKAEAKADKAEAKAEAKADKADAKASKGEAEHGHAPGEPSGHGAHGHGRGGVFALGDDFGHGRVKKAELEARLAAIRENMGERRQAHLAELKNRWGAALTHPSCREELRHHARRQAFLARAAFVAQTEVTKDKEKLVERIEKLMAKEEERHARAMERLKSMPGAAGMGPPPSTPPTTAASATKAGEK